MTVELAINYCLLAYLACSLDVNSLLIPKREASNFVRAVYPMRAIGMTKEAALTTVFRETTLRLILIKPGVCYAGGFRRDIDVAIDLIY